MKQGNYIPISTGFLKSLPKDRPYTKLEAAYCLQMDYYKDNFVTISGYSALWRWSRNKVNRFFSDLGIEIKYTKNTKNIQNQKGQIAIQIRDRYGTDNGQIRLIDNKDLQKEKDRKGTDEGQIKDRSRYTTINNNNNNNNKKKDIVDSFDYPAWLDMDLWNEFVSLRKTIKKPFKTERAIKAAIDKLETLIAEGFSQTDLFNYTLDKEYLSFYEIKDYKKHTNKSQFEGMI